MSRAILVSLVTAVALTSTAAFARSTLQGTVRDADTREPIPFVTVTMDTVEVRLTSSEGFFDFGEVPDGRHVIVFDHIAYQRRVVTVDWPDDDMPLRVTMESAQFEMEKIVVEAERVLPSYPVGAVSVSRQEVTTVPGNIANDPMRTIQAQPSCASDGVDFLSRLAIRGGDGEEHRVYFDGYPLRHHTHVSGYTGVVYDDMLSGAVLIPGAAPIQYNGCLSGVIVLEPVKPDTSLRSFRYDITAMAAGMSERISPKFAVQGSAKSSFFNLPVYRDPEVDHRSFRDALGRVFFTPRPSLRVTATALWASDEETGSLLARPSSDRTTRSVLAGLEASYRPPGWRVDARAYHSYYDTRDALLFTNPPREHEVQDTRVRAVVERRAPWIGVGAFAEAGSIRHRGTGGSITDAPFSAAGELKLSWDRRNTRRASLVLGGGGSREPWTSRFEPEAYASVRLDVGPVSLSSGARRSHQTPFIFSERRHFASLPIDAGDLVSAYESGWENAPAVSMDQVSVEAALDLPLGFTVAYNAFWREYDNLLAWNGDAFPNPSTVTSDGDGHGRGYEVTLVRNDPDFITLSLAASRARVWKREGTLGVEKVGDFDRPASWQAGASIKLSERVRVSLRWMDVDGRPYTLYQNTTAAPADSEINALRLRRFQRLDVKATYMIKMDEFDGEIFVDFINMLNRSNISMRYAIEDPAGGYTSLPYTGTRWFPIAGATVRW